MSHSSKTVYHTRSAPFNIVLLFRMLVVVVMLRIGVDAAGGLAEALAAGAEMNAAVNGITLAGLALPLVFFLRGEAGLQSLPTALLRLSGGALLASAAYFLWMGGDYQTTKPSVLEMIFVFGLVSMYTPSPTAVLQPRCAAEDLSRVVAGLLGMCIFVSLAAIALVVIIGLSNQGMRPIGDIPSQFWVVIFGGLAMLISLFPGVIFFFNGRDGLAKTNIAWLAVGAVGAGMTAFTLEDASPKIAAWRLLCWWAPYLVLMAIERAGVAKRQGELERQLGL